MVSATGVCLQEGASSTVRSDLSSSLANGTKLSSVSLAFFKHAWTNPNKKSKANKGSKVPSSFPKKPQHNNNKPGNGRKLMLFHEAEIGPNGEQAESCFSHLQVLSLLRT